jgi:hypothetical protein
MHSNFRRLMAVRLQLGIVRCWDKCEVLRGPPYCPNMALSIREGMWHPASITRRERRGAATGLRRHPRWRRRAPLALSSPSRRPSVLGVVGCPVGLLGLASFGHRARAAPLRPRDLLLVVLQRATIVLVEILASPATNLSGGMPARYSDAKLGCGGGHA